MSIEKNADLKKLCLEIASRHNSLTPTELLDIAKIYYNWLVTTE